ncbi:CHASE domain-containing protein [Erythrobacter ani]|uniref:histidine kinase n=1 Tax=Erythrobacter ani TaxID=2827235 RepID=A0ABS6SLY8_9SPHN|nr:CHASE domain-containing protein [Erythrobacter ani]MBV7266051.1 CHASE domain-containing protein [Erythrobacter ani]
MGIHTSNPDLQRSAENTQPGRRKRFSSRGRTRRWLLDYPRAIPLMIFAAIAAVTVLSVFSIESNVRARETAQMSKYGQSIASALERRGNSFSAYLRAGAALFSSVEEVTPQVFNQFVSELRLNIEYEGSEGIGWAAIASPSDDGIFDGSTGTLQPDFAPPETASLRTAPVTYLSPDSERNLRTLGYNMYSDPVRAAAMDEARQTVRPTASGKVSLTYEEGDDAPGFAIFMPVYGGDPVTRDSETSLAGFVYSTINAERFVDSAIENADASDLGLRLYDGAIAPERLLVTRALEDEPTHEIERAVSIGNRELVLVVESDDPQMLSPLSMVTLLFGLAVASLLMLLARLLTRQAAEDQSRLAFFEEQHSIRNSLTRELNHRVKNTLANVLSILSLTRRRSTDLDEFADSLEGRIRSLSATHDLLTGTDWGTTPLKAIVEAELQHFRKGAENSVSIEGPPVDLAPNDALSFGLAIHELATNAAKFGSLSVPHGEVAIAWKLLDKNLAEVEWVERCGPAVPTARSRGFGTDLIEKIVAHELKQPVELSFEKDGVRCKLRVPVRRRDQFQIREEAEAKAG